MRLNEDSHLCQDYQWGPHRLARAHFYAGNFPCLDRVRADHVLIYLVNGLHEAVQQPDAVVLDKVGLTYCLKEQTMPNMTRNLQSRSCSYK